MGAKRNRRRLLEARESGKPVWLTRSLDTADWIEGFVVDVGADWVLLAHAWDLHLDGWMAVRLDTVEDVGHTRSGKALRRALELRGEQVARIPVDLSGPGEIIRSMARRTPLITLHREHKRSDVSWIGRPVRLTRKAVHIVQVGPRAQWYDAPTRFGLRGITRIEIGARYERALYELAGEPPLI